MPTAYRSIYYVRAAAVYTKSTINWLLIPLYKYEAKIFWIKAVPYCADAVIWSQSLRRLIELIEARY